MREITSAQIADIVGPVAAERVRPGPVIQGRDFIGNLTIPRS